MSDDIEAVVVASDDDDDVPRLSAATLAALQEFYVEQMSEDQSMPKEDWQLSQFWYDDKTAQVLAEEALAITGDGGRIACLSCPSVYRKLREFARDNVSICCLEYDERFSMFGNDFVFYDYNDPLNLPEGFEKAFDVVIADPPFLSEECLRKTAITVKHLAKDRVILCTGLFGVILFPEVSDTCVSLTLAVFCCNTLKDICIRCCDGGFSKRTSQCSVLPIQATPLKWTCK